MAKQQTVDLEELTRNTKYLFTRLVMQLRLKEIARNDADGARALMDMTIQEMRLSPLFTVFINRDAMITRITDYFTQTKSPHRASEMGKEHNLFKALVQSIYSYCTEQDLIEITDALVLTINNERTVFQAHALPTNASTEHWNLVKIDLGIRRLEIYAVYKVHTHLAEGIFFFSQEMAKTYHALRASLHCTSTLTPAGVDVAGRNLESMIKEINATRPGSMEAMLHGFFNGN